MKSRLGRSTPGPSTSAARYSTGCHPILGLGTTPHADVTQGGYFTDFSIRAILMPGPLATASRAPFPVTFYTEDVEFPGPHHRELVQAGEARQISDSDAVTNSEDSSVAGPAFTSQISQELQEDLPDPGSSIELTDEVNHILDILDLDSADPKPMTSPYSNNDSLYETTGCDSFDVKSTNSSEDEFLSTNSSPTASLTFINVGDLDEATTGFYDSLKESMGEMDETEGSHLQKLQRNEESIPMPYLNNDYDMAEDEQPSTSASPSIHSISEISSDQLDQSGGNHSIPMDCSDYDDSVNQAGPSTSISVLTNAPMPPMETSLLQHIISSKDFEELFPHLSEDLTTSSGSGSGYLPNAQFSKRPRKDETTKDKKLSSVRNGAASFSSNGFASDLKSGKTGRLRMSSDRPKESHLSDDNQDLNGDEIAASSSSSSSSSCCSFEI